MKSSSSSIRLTRAAVAVLAGVVFLHEALTVWTVLGLGLVLAGSALATRLRNPNRDSGAAVVAQVPATAP